MIYFIDNLDDKPDVVTFEVDCLVFDTESHSIQVKDETKLIFNEQFIANIIRTPHLDRNVTDLQSVVDTIFQSKNRDSLLEKNKNKEYEI